MAIEYDIEKNGVQQTSTIRKVERCMRELLSLWCDLLHERDRVAGGTKNVKL